MRCCESLLGAVLAALCAASVAHAAPPMPSGSYAGETAQGRRVDLEVREDVRGFVEPSYVLIETCGARTLAFYPSRKRVGGGVVQIDASGRFHGTQRGTLDGIFGPRSPAATISVNGRFRRHGRALRGELHYLDVEGCDRRVRFTARWRPDPGVRAPGYWCPTTKLNSMLSLRPTVAASSCARAATVARRWASRHACRSNPCVVAGHRCQPVSTGHFDPTASVACGGLAGRRGTVELAVLRDCGKVGDGLYATALNLSCRTVRSLQHDCFEVCLAEPYACELTRTNLDDSANYWCAPGARSHRAVETRLFFPL